MTPERAQKTIADLRAQADELVDEFIDEDLAGSAGRYLVCVVGALDQAAWLVLQARSSRTSVSFVEDQVKLEAHLDRLGKVDRALWPQSASAVFMCHAGWSWLAVAVWFAEMVRKATARPPGLSVTASVAPEPDAAVADWMETGLEGVRMNVPRESEWPEWRVLHDVQVVRAHGLSQRFERRAQGSLQLSPC